MLSKQIELTEERDCLCEGLGSSVLIKNQLKPSHKLTAVAICPGPNLAYFSKVMSLEEMVNHIYGRANALNSLKRPHVFINELSMYVDYLKKEVENYKDSFQAKKQIYLDNFKQNLKKGIDYYEQLIPEMRKDFKENINDFSESLMNYSKTLAELQIPVLQ
jgi:predicted HicB family RNase H-like nuclease